MKLITQETPFFLSIPALLWQFFFLLIPLIIVMWSSIYDTASLTFTSAYYTTLIALPCGKILLRSLFIAGTAAATTLLCTYPIAYVIAMHIQRYKTFFLFLFALPFWTNSLILIYSWFFLLERKGIINNFLLAIGVIAKPLALDNSLGTVFVVMTYCYLPFMFMPLYTALEKIDLRLLEASSDLGATPWQTFWRITFPLSISGVKTGLLLVFIPAFGEFAIPTLLGGSRFMMIGSLISYYFFVARDSCLGAAVTVLAALTLITVTVGINLLCKLVSNRN